MKHAAQNARKMNDIGAAESAPWELELELLETSWSSFLKACKKRGGRGCLLMGVATGHDKTNRIESRNMP